MSNAVPEQTETIREILRTHISLSSEGLERMTARLKAAAARETPSLVGVKCREKWPEVTAKEVEAIERLVAPEFETGDWVTVESEDDFIGTVKAYYIVNEHGQGTVYYGVSCEIIPNDPPQIADQRREVK